MNSLSPPLTKYITDQLEQAQNQCIRHVFGGSKTSSIQDRAHFLQAQFLLRSLHLPHDTLLYRLLPHIRASFSSPTWYRLSKSPLWRKCQPNINSINRHDLYRIYLQARKEDLQSRQSSHKHTLLSHCRTKISMNPILWLPMTHGEHSRCIRWRLS
ncbi:hypothetical protein A0J61_08895 [Choanephora cucurbitarum]|uniref:Uncharacterized protein n=1 Tax=Choanephora cucurbitarum TaxID=101091 RepID=A0A1C7N6V1_9FUNG|nr:hypothetical protein A0J61_08895 [Choanephora cucurbitarum]